MTLSQHLFNGACYGLLFSAYRGLQAFNLLLDLVLFTLFIVTSFLYVLEGLHNIIKFWIELEVKKAQQPMLEPTKETLLLPPANNTLEESIMLKDTALDSIVLTDEGLEPAITCAEEPCFSTWTVKQLKETMKCHGIKPTRKARKAQLVEEMTLLYSMV
jgi:hypothetical protein